MTTEYFIKSRTRGAANLGSFFEISNKINGKRLNYYHADIATGSADIEAQALVDRLNAKPVVNMPSEIIVEQKSYLLGIGFFCLGVVSALIVTSIIR